MFFLPPNQQCQSIEGTSARTSAGRKQRGNQVIQVHLKISIEIEVGKWF